MSETPRQRRQRLRALLDEPAQTMEAIRKGEVDAFVVSDLEQDDRVYVLKAADRHHRLIVESMGEGAMTLSADGAITYCNPHAVELLGRNRNEILGHTLRDFITAETRALFDALLGGAEETGTRAEVELHGSGGPIPVAVSATPLSDPEGSHFCLILSDLRDQRTREQLRAEKEAAELANRAKDDFLAMVSHELRSPITVILGWTRMLQMNRVNRETLKLSIDSIHQSTARLIKLVEDILDASRLQSGTVALQLEAVDLRESIRASIPSVQFEVDQKPLQLTVRMPDQPVMVRGDLDRLQQVVVNLLANAVKFTPAGGRIDLDLEVTEGQARVHVRDTGEGIDPSFLPYVFERFRQDDSSTTRAHKGLGLGLAIVKQLVDVHGGSVSAHSDGKGKGAEFVVTLPITTEQQKTAAASSSDPLPSLDGVRVLLVDDEIDTIDVMRTILRSAGAAVDAATSVSQALELAAQFAPHVIVSDIAMPGEDGFRFKERVAANIPMLAITGKGTAAERDEILAAGFRRHLVKPIEPEALIRAVRALAAT